jgi:pimeloyl-ACP methyl ester carboxylesterase
MISEHNERGSITQELVLGRTLRYRASRVLTPDGVSVAVQDWAPDAIPRTADIVLLHGFSQAHGAWLHQVSSPLAEEFRLVTYDLRGHGASDKPPDAHFYRSGDAWAGELKAVIEALGLKQPVLVGWSYSGRVVLDYLNAFGDAAIGGLIMVNATSKTDPAMMGPAVGLLRQMTSADPATAAQGTRQLLHACVAKPLPHEEFEYMLRYNTLVPAAIRANLAGRTASYEAALQALRVPTLVMQGSLDVVTAPVMSAYTAAQVRGARLITYEDLAHMPFWESAQRFNDDVAHFVRQQILMNPGKIPNAQPG